MPLPVNILLLVVGFVLLMKGADVFVDGSSSLAGKLGIPQIVIGLTIVAFGTSAPEAAISITAGIKGSAELAVSNVVGSNILNVLLILGIASVITPLAVKKILFYRNSFCCRNHRCAACARYEWLFPFKI